MKALQASVELNPVCVHFKNARGVLWHLYIRDSRMYSGRVVLSDDAGCDGNLYVCVVVQRWWLILVVVSAELHRPWTGDKIGGPSGLTHYYSSLSVHGCR